MGKPQPKHRRDMTPLERAIDSRERGIATMRRNIERIQREADNDIAEIKARITEKQILLDALKKGALRG